MELAEHAIEVQSSVAGTEHELHGAGLRLVPCVFAWPHVMVDIDAGNPPSITYRPRGIGELWPQTPPPEPTGNALAALLGRTRAAILRAVALPKSTSDLAAELDQSMPAVSAHLAVLRRAGLVSSWLPGGACSTNPPRSPAACSPPAAPRPRRQNRHSGSSNERSHRRCGK